MLNREYYNRRYPDEQCVAFHVCIGVYINEIVSSLVKEGDDSNLRNNNNNE